jgi:HSP20 family protein
MTIERWDPFREMISLRDAMNSLLAESFVRPGGPLALGGAATLPLPLDVAETEGEFVIKASLPGIKPEDVHITAHGDTLTIRGEGKAEAEQEGTHWHVRERRVTSFARTISLGTPIHADAASARFDHGVLTLTLPKSAESRPRQIKVASGPIPPRSSDRPEPAAPERDLSGTAKHDPAQPPPNPGGKPAPTHDLAAEQAREAHEAETARNAVASSRERMVDIGRGNQQAGRQGQ